MPFCPACGNQHAETDRFCAQCGRALAADAAPPPALAPSGQAGPGVQAVAPAPAPPPPPLPTPAGPVPEQVLWEGTPHGLLNPIESHAIRWELTTERLRVIRGLLSRATEEIELTRVRDVSYEQSLAQRALGIGTVSVMATDVDTPLLLLHDIEEPEQVKELIRQAAREQRQRFRVRQLEVDEQL
jgi:PH (Pleckstrin Homology) domain-containing protein/zinc ribbon protein